MFIHTNSTNTTKTWSSEIQRWPRWIYIQNNVQCYRSVPQENIAQWEGSCRTLGTIKEFCDRIRGEAHRVCSVKRATLFWKISHRVGNADSQNICVQVRLNKRNRILVEHASGPFSFFTSTQTEPMWRLLRIVLTLRKQQILNSLNYTYRKMNDYMIIHFLIIIYTVHECSISTWIQVKKEFLDSINIHIKQNFYKSTLKVTRFTKVMAFYSNLNIKNIFYW